MQNQQNNPADVVGAALVVGGGVGGMQAALDLAANDIMVCLVDRKPCIGGKMPQLDKAFPTNDCSMCMLAPRLVETGRHPNIEIITLAEVTGLEGTVGNFKAHVRKKARYVDESLCVGCGDCWEKCPVRKFIPSEYDAGLVSRRAIYRPFPQAIPNIATLDKETCIYFKKGKCKVCQKICKADAINFDMQDEEITLDVGAVILAPGYEIYNVGLKKEYGYERYPNVVTSLEFERILSASGPFDGNILRPSDREHPKNMAFIQCVGSREPGAEFCSSVCCMYTAKNSILAKEHEPDLECTIFYIDIRAFGKGFEVYYEKAKQLGVRYVRSRPSAVKQVPKTKNLMVKYFAEDGRTTTEEFDMVVLSVGMQPPQFSKELGEVFGIDYNEHGFCRTSDFAPLQSGKEGVFVCGPFVEPKDIPETVVQASGSASRVLEILMKAKGTRTPEPKQHPAEIDVRDQPPRVGVFICHCGTNIAGSVNVPEAVEYSKTLPDVVHAEDCMYACSSDMLERIKTTIKDHDLNRVVVASCSPRTHETHFRNTLPEQGLNPYLFEMANIRDQCSWVHMQEPEKATHKAMDLIRMAIAKARLLEPIKTKYLDITRSALVIGGGVSGMTAAKTMADQGFETHLVEKETELGGNFRRIRFLMSGANPSEKLSNLVEQVKSHPKIHLHTGATIADIQGFAGNFKTTIAGPEGKKTEVHHGTVTMATGAKEYTPTEYFYGQSEKVVLQLQLEELLQDVSKVQALNTVVMIQCVGSRDSERPYCSRICCSQAVKNALKIKELSPQTDVFILYRDMRTYGFSELAYKEAREKGVIFLRYADNEKPVVAQQNGGFSVSLTDPVLHLPVTIHADLISLSAAIVPHSDNDDLIKMLKLPQDTDNFFLEAHVKLQPVDFAARGIFLCGIAHLPKRVDECIAQATATGARAGAILSKDRIALQANLSVPVDANCDGCAFCIDTCPFKAITLVEYMNAGSVKKTVDVNEGLCKGCGICQATCPKQGIYIDLFKIDQLAAMVDAALEPGPGGY